MKIVTLTTTQGVILISTKDLQMKTKSHTSFRPAQNWLASQDTPLKK